MDTQGFDLDVEKLDWVKSSDTFRHLKSGCTEFYFFMWWACLVFIAGVYRADDGLDEGEPY